MPVNDKILYTDYNTLRNAVAQILGTGSATSGYGQIVQSSAVSGANGTGSVLGGGTGANRIRADDYSRLRWDIINVYKHIYGVEPTPANPVIGQLIRWVTAAAAVTSEYNISEYNIAEYNASSIAGSNDPYTQYSVFITDIQNNRFTCATSQSRVDPQGSAIRTNSWGGGLATIGTRIRFSWPNANEARYFFNSGGEIRITSTRTNPGGTPETSQTTAWTNLLNGAGTRSFSAQLPNLAFGLANGSNWYNLTSSYQSWYSLSSSSPYALNQYRIEARTLDGLVANNVSGTSAGVDIRVLFQDNYRDPDDTDYLPGQAVRVAPDDSVFGTLTVSCALKIATGVLQPENPPTGNFTIQSPTVTFTGNTTGVPGNID
jgi:hypothetical protein